MDGHIRWNLTNLGAVMLVSVLGIGLTVIVINYFSGTSVPILSHLSRGGQVFLSGGQTPAMAEAA